MADLEKAARRPEEQLWKQLAETHAGMLGVQGSGLHMQPMAHIQDDTPRTLWFFTDRMAELTRAIGDGATAHFCLVGKDHDYYACIRGALRQHTDPERIDALWSPLVAAWYEGKDDPNLCLLEFTARDAMIWASADSAVRFGWEIVKANVAGGKPDVGVANTVTFG